MFMRRIGILIDMGARLDPWERYNAISKLVKNKYREPYYIDCFI